MLIQKKLNRDAGKLRLRLKQAFSLLFACLMVLQTGMVTAFAAPSASVIRSDELRGVWISYLDWERLPADQESFKREVDKIVRLFACRNQLFVSLHDCFVKIRMLHEPSVHKEIL